MTKNPLQQLLADYLRDHPGENYSTIARRGGMPRQTVQALAQRSGRVAPPRAETLERLAAGMGMKLALVREAAGLAAGYGGQDGLDERTQMLALYASQLSEEGREELIRWAAFLRQEALDKRPVT